MEVHVDYHCSVCGWRPGEPIKAHREISAREMLDILLGKKVKIEEKK
jgi:hypothetical protein